MSGSPSNSLARADRARRDLLEAVTHEPRGNNVDVYTTFPWAALCDEVKKLKIGLRAGLTESMGKNCDPSGSLSNLRLVIPFNLVALRAA